MILLSVCLGDTDGLSILSTMDQADGVDVHCSGKVASLGGLQLEVKSYFKGLKGYPGSRGYPIALLSF